MADVLASTLACASANASVNSSGYVPQRPSKVPIAPMGFSHVLRVCLQGGGVHVESGTVSFLSCTITGNSANSVRAQLKTSHRPDGKIADALAPTHACTTANASVNYRMYVLQRPCKLPIAPMGTFTCLCSLVLAGRRCRCFGWHGELLIVHHHWQHSYWSACSCSKLPIAPMGILLTCLP